MPLRFQLFILSAFLTIATFDCFGQEPSNNGRRTGRLLTKNEMEKEAIRATQTLQEAINLMMDMGRSKKGVWDESMERQLNIILDDFLPEATIVESNCINGVPQNGPPKSIRRYLMRMFKKSGEKEFVIHFGHPQIDPNNGNNWLEYKVNVDFWQSYDSATYDDDTLKQVRVIFQPIGNNHYKVYLGNISVLKTICGRK